jgi:DNA-binding response OmpR family regulator
MNVLLVDDEIELVTTLAERLGLRGIHARWAADADAASRLVEEEPFDIAVLDMKLPKMDGLELKRRLQEIRPELKFIFVTGHGSNAAYETASSEVGSGYYLAKPLDIERLILKMKEVLQR